MNVSLQVAGLASCIPAYSAILAQPEMIQFIHRHNLYSITIQKDKKAWRFLVSDKRQAEARRKADECDEEYDESWNHTLLSALFGHIVTAPAMPCVPPAIHPHREKESTCEGSGGATSSVLFGVWMDRKQQQDKVYAAVTRLLDRKEAHRDPAAIEAIKKEGAALLESQTWDQSTVTEREDVLAKARAEHDTICTPGGIDAYLFG